MRILLVLVSALVILLGITYLVILAVGPQEKTIVQTRYIQTAPPQTVVINDNAAVIDRLESQIDNLERQLQVERNNRVYNERVRYVYRDRHDDDEWDLKVWVEDEDGDPIDDARVRVENGDTEIEYTNDNGRAIFRDLEEDCYDIEVEASGYLDEDDDICLDDDESITIELEQ